MDNNLHKGASPKLFEHAQLSRKKLTKAEIIIWNNLRNKQLGYKFRRQHPLKDFIADFYCHECNLIIEIDGEYHQEKEQASYDTGRTFELNELQIKVIRFTNYEVISDLDLVLSEIKKYLIPDPSPQGEGRNDELRI